jgi:hypothetical protein
MFFRRIIYDYIWIKIDYGIDEYELQTLFFRITYILSIIINNNLRTEKIYKYINLLNFNIKYNFCFL